MERAHRALRRVLGLVVPVLVAAGCAQKSPTEVTEEDPPVISPVILPDAHTGDMYTVSLDASGGTGSYVWGLLDELPPEGLSILEDGTIRGVPLASGVTDFRVIVSDQSQRADTANLSIVVHLGFPEPVLTLDTAYVRSGGSRQFVYYDLSVSNWSAFVAELFEQRPDLPPCGLNERASRTWVEIYDASGGRLYGFCALRSGAGLNDIWFAVAVDEPAPDGAYIELWDRALDRRVRSNTVAVPGR